MEAGKDTTNLFGEFEKERWDDRVMRCYRFTNSEPSKLGREPLPDGEGPPLRTSTLA